MSDNPYAAPQTLVTPATPVTYSAGSMHSPYGGYRDLKVFHLLVMLFLGIGIVTALGETYAAEMMNRGLTMLDEGGDFEATINQAHTLSQSFTNLSSIILLFTIVFWGIWKNRACKNAWFFYSQSGRPNHFADKPTPGWAVGYYFVPIINLWKPYQAMTFIRDQCSGYAKVGPLLEFWWGGALLMYGYSRYHSRTNRLNDVPTVEEAITFNNSIMIEGVITIVASFLAAAVIHQLSDSQKRKARDLGAIL